ncbi:hypothetical protein [Arthrobacter koreensis]|uniref:hypothetical protein n=1 Tax=Arthrobacter koreensis TaxID=199136 RepID=UPI0037FB5487
MAFQKLGTPKMAAKRPITEVLKDRTGSGMAEGLGGLALMMMLVASIAAVIVTDMDAVQTLAVKAERQSAVTALVDDKRRGASWGTAEAPTTQTVTLENGTSTDVTVWREDTPVGTTLSAVTATSAGTDAPDCSAPSDVDMPGCLYASRFHAAGMDGASPHYIIRKDPSTAAAPAGTVHTRVGTDDPVPQGSVLASGKDTEASTWRYLISAVAVEPAGEIRISQGGRILATIPVDRTTKNYFGTFSAEPNTDVQVTVTQGNIAVQTVMTYRAGGNQ